MSNFNSNIYFATYYLFRAMALVKIVDVTGFQTSKETGRAVCAGPQVRKGKAKATEDMTKQTIKELREITSQLKLVNDSESRTSIYKNPKAMVMSSFMHRKSTSNNQSTFASSVPKGNLHGLTICHSLLVKILVCIFFYKVQSLHCVGEIKISKKVEPANDQAIIDIDSKHKDPQMCSLYAAEVYNNLRVTEVCI